MMTWAEKFMQWHGKPLPDNYLVFDMETTGVKRDYDLPVEIGHTIVRNRKPVHRGSFILNWMGYPGMDPNWLQERIENVTYQMGKKGLEYRYPIARLEAEGRDPYEVLDFYVKLFEKNRQAGSSFVGHNAWNFDAVMLQHITGETLGTPWEFGPDELFDTGGMEKAIQADMEPFPDEHTLQKYFSRVCYSNRKGLKWNVAYCVERYDLVAKYGINIDDLHGAGPDSYVCHLLFEEHRNYAG